MEHGKRKDIDKNVCLSAFRSYTVVLLALEREMLSVGSETLGNALKLRIRGTLSLQMGSLTLT